MDNVFSEAGKLIIDATHELEQSRREISVTKWLLKNEIVGSASTLSWIRNGKTQNWDLYVWVLYEITSLIEPSMREDYRLKLSDLGEQLAKEREIERRNKRNRKNKPNEKWEWIF